MASLIAPYDDQSEQYLKDQLAQADALRQLSFQRPIGSGMAGRVYMPGSPVGNILAGLLGNYQAGQARQGLQQLQQSRQQARRDFLNQMPSAFTTQTKEMQGPPVPGQEGEAVGTTTQQLPKSTKQYAQDLQNWGMK